MAKIPWDKENWNKIKGEIQAEYGLTENREIQEKLLQITREHRK